MTLSYKLFLRSKVKHPLLAKSYKKFIFATSSTLFVFLVFQVWSGSIPLYQGKITSDRTRSLRDLNNREDMLTRRAQIDSTCKLFPNMSEALMTSKWLVSRKHNFLYCPVEKVASTFWRRFLHQLEYTNPMRSPFDISAHHIYSQIDTNTSVYETKNQLAQLLDKSIKLLFVRDPFNRLFSAYVDKLLAPNPIFWRIWGVRAIQQFRSTPKGGQAKPACGDDVTFGEFVSLSVSPVGQLDHHLMRIVGLCSPCYVNYTIVGKMETFARDTGLLLRHLDINESDLHLDRMSDDVTKDAVEDSVLDAMSPTWMNKSLGCISKDDVIARIWRKLQIRGFISWRIDRQMAPENVRDINGALLTDLLKMAVLASTNRTELSIQKSQALLEAYSTLAENQFDSIRRVYDMDFKLFNYNSQPEELSPTRLAEVKHTGAFDWRKKWDLTSIL
ncbi:carbohydrate sulfotransferase 10 isoform X1 [Biomphalaria glabrata]|nr:carbohydrate sulfotransferase 10 isoform X1 [Biomphalaria glabrata]